MKPHELVFVQDKEAEVARYFEISRGVPFKASIKVKPKDEEC